MKLEQLKEEVKKMQSSAEEARSSLGDACSVIDDIESYADSCREQIKESDYTISNIDDNLEDLQIHLDNLEGFDMDMEDIRTQVKEEMIFELTNKFGKFIKEALASDLPTDELKKAPAKKSTETDNQFLLNPQ